MSSAASQTRLYRLLLLVIGAAGATISLLVDDPLPSTAATVNLSVSSLVLAAWLATTVSAAARSHTRHIMIGVICLYSGPDVVKHWLLWTPGDEIWLVMALMITVLAISVLARRWRDVVLHGVYVQAFLAASALIPKVDGRVLGFVAVAAATASTCASVVTAIRLRTEAALREAREEAEEQRSRAERAARVKAEFLASMSHEIRTPMNGVIGMADLLSDTQLSHEQAEYVETIRTSGTALLTIINDILDLSKIEARGIELEVIPFDPARLVREAAAIVRPQAEAKGLRVVVEVAAGVPSAVTGDPTRVRQIVLNLLSNAVKFTKEGCVTLRLTVPTLARLRFEVEDTGIGIPPDRLDAIFDAFTQADASTTRQYGGTGLGLAISARLAGRMGGQLVAESDVGRGSTFSFEIAAPIARASELPTAVAGPAVGADHTLRVLVAEDNAINQRVVLRLLDRIGYSDVTLAHDGVETLDALHAASDAGTPFDVVLMDVQMPHLDGLEATRRLRTELLPEHQPEVWMLTANAMAGDRDVALDAGADGYLTKPIDRAELAKTLQKVSSQVALASS